MGALHRLIVAGSHRFSAKPARAAGRRNYLSLTSVPAGNLADGPEPLGRATAAGATWGRTMAAERGVRPDPSRPPAVRTLVDLLDEVGFAPEPAPPGQRRWIGLRNCPFLDLVDAREIVNAIQLGAKRPAHQPAEFERNRC